MRRLSAPVLVLLLALVVFAACSSDDGGTTAPTATPSSGPTSTTEPVVLGEASERYGDLDLWHCHPDKVDDVCDTTLLDADEILPDGTIVPVAHEPAADPPVDCFYVYPTVDLAGPPGNRSFDEEINPLERVVVGGQLARFSEVCRLFAPRYEQMTISGYRDENSAEYLGHATDQVAEALDHYLATENGGRPFVLIGHSQGSHHLTSILATEFEGDPAMQQRLLSALLIGPTGRVQVPPGETVGATFAEIELCTSADETGCIIAYDSYGPGQEPLPSGPDSVSACVNPAELMARFEAGDDAPDLATGGATAGSAEPFVSSGSYFGASTPGTTARYELWSESYTAACTTTVAGQQYLAIDVLAIDGDERVETQVTDNRTGTLHLSDINFALRDLIEIVRIQSGQT